MKTIIDNYEFITFKKDNAEFIFSTAKNDLNFNKDLKEGRDNLKLLQDYFNLKDVGYVNQIHSSIIQEYDGTVKSGDAIVTDKTNIGIGIFTADCVPVLIYDKNKNIAAAVHSGWKGTSGNITSKAISYLADRYGSCAKDLTVYIGPHNRECCYEFGDSAIYEYFGDIYKKDKSIYINNKLNLEKCIYYQLMDKEVSSENINTLDLCTYCSSEYKFYSYRRDKSSGRMFSFVVIRNN